MYTMVYDITVGSYTVGMLDRVEIHRSVELLADTAKIVLPASQFNAALHVENKIRRGDFVSIGFGYEETGQALEFQGYVQRISTDDGSITLECEDRLFLFRKAVPDTQQKKVSLKNLLQWVINQTGAGLKLDCSYTWTYDNYVTSSATGFDVLQKVQKECGADIYIDGETLHVHAPGEKVGNEVLYDFSLNIEKSDLSYLDAENRKVKVVVKSLQPDGTVKEMEFGNPDGDKVEIRANSTDTASMTSRGQAELKRHSYTGYDGCITTWLVPYVKPGDMATLHDRDYEHKDGSYYVQSVTTTFGSNGGSRQIELGFKLS